MVEERAASFAKRSIKTKAKLSGLKMSVAMMDLTTLEDCLLCGAYEAVAAAKPLVISNTRALADYFGATVVLTENAPEPIAASIQRAYAQRDELAHMTREWSGRNEVFMAERIATLQDTLRALCTVGARAPAKRAAS